MSTPQVGVFPPDALDSRRRMFAALGRLFGLDFVTARGDALHTFSYLVVFARSRADADHLASTTQSRILAFVTTPDAKTVRDVSSSHFLNHGSVSQCFRGGTFVDHRFAPTGHLDLQTTDGALAMAGSRPWWLQTADARLDVVATDLPELGADEYLVSHFHSDRWIALVPVLQFLQQATPWRPPEMRACFMFDDPNLHWPTYGYVNYSHLAQLASAEGLHVAFATVPLDGWYVNTTVASTIRRNARHLSLLIHGNDHAADELMSLRGQRERLSLACQALRRIDAVEKKSGLAVARVMAAPYGACDAGMASALAQAGFDAACISRASLMDRNRSVVWPQTVGLTLAEMFAELPVIPRFNMKRERHATTNARLTAFLGQPVVPVGHHDDLGSGVTWLSELGSEISSMGAVRWCSMSSIAESNFACRRDGSTFTVMMFSRRVKLLVDDRTAAIAVRRPWVQAGQNEDLQVRLDGVACRVTDAESASIPVNPGQTVELLSVHPTAVDWRSVASGSATWRAVARRHASEGRDRLRPIFDRVQRHVKRMVGRPRNLATA